MVDTKRDVIAVVDIVSNKKKSWFICLMLSLNLRPNGTKLSGRNWRMAIICVHNSGETIIELKKENDRGFVVCS